MALIFQTILTVLLTSTAVPLGASFSLGDSIPTSLVLPVDANQQSAPVCSVCRVATRKYVTPEGIANGAAISFTYEDDDGAAYVGGVWIMARLDDGTDVTVAHESMTVAAGQTVVFDLHNGEWTWDQVALVSFQLTDTQ